MYRMCALFAIPPLAAAWSLRSWRPALGSVLIVAACLLLDRRYRRWEGPPAVVMPPGDTSEFIPTESQEPAVARRCRSRRDCLLAAVWPHDHLENGRRRWMPRKQRPEVRAALAVLAGVGGFLLFLLGIAYSRLFAMIVLYGICGGLILLFVVVMWEMARREFRERDERRGRGR
jgi:hypothetical protein